MLFFPQLLYCFWASDISGWAQFEESLSQYAHGLKVSMLTQPLWADVQKKWVRHLYRRASQDLMFARNFGRALSAKCCPIKKKESGQNVPLDFHVYFPERNMSDIFIAECLYKKVLKYSDKIEALKGCKADVYDVLKQAVLCAYTKTIEKGSALEKAAERWGYKTDLHRYEGVMQEVVVRNLIRRGVEELVEENRKMQPFLKEKTGPLEDSGFCRYYRVLLLDGDKFLGTTLLSASKRGSL